MQKPNNVEAFMITEDRSDAEKWAWPGFVRESWSNPGGDELFAELLGPDATEESTQETRMVQQLGAKSMGDSFANPEDMAYVEFTDLFAPSCAEEPDAPDVRLRLCRPKNRNDKELLPVVFFVLSGGFWPEPTVFDSESAMFVHDLECAVLIPQYRLFPEHMFPCNINDLQASYEWVINHGAEYGLDADRIVIYGQSAGGWFGISLCHRLKRLDIKPMPRGVVANGPVMDDRGIGRSGRFQWSDGGYVGLSAYQYCWESYVGYGNVGKGALGPEAWPNHAFPEDVVGMPPMAIHVNESDPCRDAGIEYALKLLNANVFCALHVWPGTQHAFVNELNLVNATDPYVLRFKQEQYEDMKGFMQYDFRRGI